MTHPSDDLLLRLALDRTSGEESSAVQAHLGTGCDSCASAFATYLRASTAAGPVADATRDWLRPRTLPRGRGVRSGALADYQIVCGAGPYELDVLIRDTAGEESLSFVGQVTWADRVHEPVTSLPLTLVSAPTIGSPRGGRTNEFGEFQMASERAGTYGLQLGARTDAPCVMVWEGWDE